MNSGKSKCSTGEEDSKHFIPETYGLNVDSNKEDYAKVINSLQQQMDQFEPSKERARR